MKINATRMIERYYVDTKAQQNGDHEVHREGCIYLPLPDNRLYLGEFLTCHAAVMEAKKYHEGVNGCVRCCKPCHSS